MTLEEELNLGYFTIVVSHKAHHMAEYLVQLLLKLKVKYCSFDS